MRTRPTKRFYRTFAFSLALHLLFFAILFFSIESEFTTPDQVAIELREVPVSAEPGMSTGSDGSKSDQIKVSRGRGGKGGEQKSSRRNEISPAEGLKAFSSKFNINTKGDWGRGGGADVDTSGWSPEQWGSRGGLFKEIEGFSQYDRLFEEVRNMLFYPGVLARHSISGSVNARLTFDGKSYCDWRRSRVQGGHPYLRFYVLALLRKLCKFETVEHMRFHEGQTADLSFQFALVPTGETEGEQMAHERIVGNVLMFYRSAQDSPLEYRLGPLRGYLFAPVISLDFPWIFENWETYVEGKDPFQEFKE